MMFVNFDKDPFFIEVLKRLQNRHGYNIISVSAGLRLNHFPEGGFESIDSTLLHRERTIAKAFKGCRPALLTAREFQAFSECRTYFSRTLDRVFLTPIPVRSQETFFNELLSYILSYFRKNRNIEAVIFDAAPHVPWDIAIFFVARYLKIETRIVKRTLLNDRVILDSDFRKAFGKIIRFDENEQFVGDIEIPKKGNASFWLGWSKSVNQRLKNSIFSSIIMEFIAAYPWLVVFFLKSCRKYRVGYARLAPGRFFLFLNLQKIKVLALRRWLLANCDTVSMSVPFIYFALHFQPERSTDPEAEDFTHQYLALRILADSLPAGWRIYVKEHPRQISPHPDVRMTHYRSIEDYKMIRSIPNVDLVHPEYDAEALIAHCRMTATCTGSTVWEGMLDGKPGITFGRVWHNDCESSFVVSGREECAEAFRVLSKKNKTRVEKDVQDFLSEFQCSMIVSSNSEMSASASKIPRETLIYNLADAIRKSLP